MVEYFHENPTHDHSLVRGPGKFNPPRGRNRMLDIFIDQLNTYPIANKIMEKKRKSNITKSEWQALISISQRNDIIIKPADKGGAMVIMESDIYKEQIYEILNDTETYQRCSAMREKEISKRLIFFVDKFKTTLTNNEIEYISNINAKQSFFYGLPKVHKSDILKRTLSNENQVITHLPGLRDFPLRPIVAGPASATQHLSKLMDILLKPYMEKIKSFIQDDFHFLKRLNRHTTENAILVTFDIRNLYSEIPHDLGLMALRFWLEKYPELLDHRFTANFILEGVSLILHNNVFWFNNEAFLQLKGTAMGTKCAPVYASLTIGYLEEEKLYNKVEETFNTEMRNYISGNWFRYLDDCQVTWPFSREQLNTFHQILNDIDPNITFVMDTSETEIPFLDILLIKKGRHIITDIYRKPTDTQDYLPFKSCHPRHIKNNIPYNLARRIRSIVDEPHLERTRLNELIPILHNKGYPENLIKCGIDKALRIPKEELRNSTKITNQDDPLTFISTHNPNNPDISKFIRDNMQGLCHDNEMRQVFGGKRFINSKRQAPNLKKYLCKAKMPSGTDACVKKCNEPRCGTCPYLLEGKAFIFKNNNYKFTVRNDMNCKSSNLIYVIRCEGCKAEYVGQTGTPLRLRVTVHKQQIRDPTIRQLGLSDHLEACAVRRGISPSFKIFPFYKLMTLDQTLREIKEAHFIKKFKPTLNAINRR